MKPAARTVHKLALQAWQILFPLLFFGKYLYFSRETATHFHVSMTMIAGAAGLLLVMVAPLGPIPRGWRKGYLAFADLIITLLCLSNLLYYRYFADVLSLSLLGQAGQVGAVWLSVLALMKSADLLLFLDFVPLCFMKPVEWRRGKGLKTAIIGLLLMSMGAVQLAFEQKEILSGMYDRTYIVKHAGLIPYHLIDGAHYVRDKLMPPPPISPAERRSIQTALAENRQELAKGQNLKGIARGKNLIVIQVEALQNFVIDKRVGGQEITPFLNRFKDKSLYFANFYTQTAKGGTSDAEFLTLTSLYPIADGAVYSRYAGNDYRALPEILAQAGYYTAAFHGYKPGFWNRYNMYRTLGFQRFYSEQDFTVDETVGLGLSDPSFFRQSAAIMEGLPRPFYTFLVTLSSHYPFADIPDIGFDPGEFSGTLAGDYFKAIHYADQALGQFIADLDRRGLLQDAVVVIYGDHRALTREQTEPLTGWLGLGSLDSLAWAELGKVPLIIHLPNDQGAGERKIAGGEIDVAPTLANLMGVEQSFFGLGRDLLNADKGLVVFRDGSYTDGETFYIAEEDRLYDTRSGRPRTPGSSNKRTAARTQLTISDQIVRYDLSGTLK